MQIEDFMEADIDAAEKRKELEEYAEQIREESFSVKWPSELNDFLEKKIGHLFYVDSPPVDIVGNIELVYDMYMPRRMTTTILATSHLLEAMNYYCVNNIGPIPSTWAIRSGNFSAPTAEIIRFRFKTASTHACPTEQQLAKWDVASSSAPAMYSFDDMGISVSPAIYDDPAICYFLYGGRKEPVNTDFRISLSHLKRVLGETKIYGKSEDRTFFFNNLRHRFPNYASVLTEMGWSDKSIPSSPEDLPEKLYDAYQKVEMFEHQAMKEKIYRLSKVTGNISQMSNIIKAMDDETIMKRARTKRKDEEKGSGAAITAPSWT